MIRLPLFDGLESQVKRDRALATVGANSGDFMADGLTAIRLFLHGEYTGEDVRRELLDRGIAPHHPNAWGALIRSAVLKGLLEETGQWVKAKSVKSHASRYPVYRTRK